MQSNNFCLELNIYSQIHSIFKRKQWACVLCWCSLAPQAGPELQMDWLPLPGGTLCVCGHTPRDQARLVVTGQPHRVRRHPKPTSVSQAGPDRDVVAVAENTAVELLRSVGGRCGWRRT